jgi:ketose-bisphosphate aldolase
MPIESAGDLIRPAYEQGYAVAAFNCQGGQYDMVRAILDTAEEERAPVILMAYEANTAYYGLDWLPKLAAAMAEKYTIPFAVHLDHGGSVAVVRAAVDSRFTSVMIDFSTRSLADNIAATREVIAAAGPAGVSVEAEIGELQRNDEGPPAEPKNLVNPADVREFLAGVSVDMLAVGIGNAHGFYKGVPNIRVDLLREVRAAAGGTPLVLHGSTGIPDGVVRECIRGGMAKINFGTLLRVNFLEAMRKGLEGGVDHSGHIWRVSRYATEQIKGDVRRIIRLTGSAGRV